MKELGGDEETINLNLHLLLPDFCGFKLKFHSLNIVSVGELNRPGY